VDVSVAVDTRMSCRAFLPQPVPESTLREILDRARRAPSGGNLQPWHLYALTGATLERFLVLVRAKLEQHPRGEGAEYDVYPPDLTEPYRARRHRCGEDLYATIAIARDDRPGRLRQFARNYQFFGAPVGMFVCVDRQMGPPQWSDLGMYLQTVMLLAREHGLHTCAQEAWAVWHAAVSEFLALPPELMLFCGLALGYRDESAPINALRTERAPLSEYATLLGFA
jgi:nitroreductase